MSSNNEYQTEENDKGGHFLAMAMTSSKLLFSEEKDKKTDLLDEVKIQGGGIGCCDCDIKIFVARTFCHELSRNLLDGIIIKVLSKTYLTFLSEFYFDDHNFSIKIFF